MELSERIKTARLAAGLSQKQLCGDVITRNMLSLIEGGKARPSMDTLRHFAARLGKPMSYFLDEDAVVSSNQNLMAQAEIAYENGDFSQVLTLLEGYEAPDAVFDNVKNLLLCLSCEKLARRALAEGKNGYARALLEQAENARVNTIYAPGRKESNILRYRMDPGCAGMLEIDIDELILIRAEAALQAGDALRAAEVLGAAGERSGRWHLLRGKAAYFTKDYQAACRHLSAAEAQFPKETVGLLEQAYLAMGDYKKAYEYAKKH